MRFLTPQEQVQDPDPDPKPKPNPNPIALTLISWRHRVEEQAARHDRDWEAWRGAAGDRARLGLGGRPAGGQPPRQTTPLAQLLAENYHGRHR